MEAATVWVVTEDDDSIGNGSGFLVADGIVMTNAHVVKDLGKGGKVYVLNERLPLREATIVKIVHDKTEDEEVGGRDFALLRFTTPKSAKLPTLSFNFDVKRMDRVSAWGYPVMVTKFDKSTRGLREGDSGGLVSAPVVYTEGTVSTIVTDRLGSAIIHTAAIAGGNSGGPLVNGRGEVVGINTWGYKEDDEGAFLNMSIPANDIVAFLRENGVEPQFAPGQIYVARTRPAAPPSSSASGARKPGREPEDRIRDAGSFTVKVPTGWSVLDEEENMVLLGADDDSAAVGVLVAENGDMSLDEVAAAYAEEFDASEPVFEDDVYTFRFEDDGVENFVVLGGGEDEGTHVMIFISGDGGSPGVEEVLNSVEDK
ncbi:MAG: S1 family peptidase [Synergistaceae bacterium]|nr:S1 family peptidase [Synergistaceae bacterium]